MTNPVTRRSALAAGLAATATGLVAPTAGARVRRPGRLRTATAYSPTLDEDIAYTVYLPAGYPDGGRYPTAYLLHGRGDDMTGWTRVKDSLDAMIDSGAIPPIVAVMPDAPWSDRGSYYVDSAYAGEPVGRPVETALTTDLVGHVDRRYRTVRHRRGRIVGGYSMGGYGALRYSLAHRDLFAGALVLSPAVYTPLPPADSSTREFGAYGRGADPFVEAIYRRLNYPALLPSVDPSMLTAMWLAVGDDEWPNPLPADYRHDLDFETAVVHNAVKRVDGITSQLRVLDGGHDWDVWLPSFEAGLPWILRELAP
jgi:enterochelin esterase-like enzyme